MILKRLISCTIMLGLILCSNGFVFGGTKPRPLTTSATVEGGGYITKRVKGEPKGFLNEDLSNDNKQTTDQKRNPLSKVAALVMTGVSMSVATIVRSMCYDYPHSFTLKNFLCSCGGILTGTIGFAALAGGIFTTYKVNQCTKFSGRDPLHDIPMAIPERLQLIIRTSGIPVAWGCLMGYASYRLFKAI